MFEIDLYIYICLKLTAVKMFFFKFLLEIGLGETVLNWCVHTYITALNNSILNYSKLTILQTTTTLNSPVYNWLQLACIFIVSIRLLEIGLYITAWSVLRPV